MLVKEITDIFNNVMNDNRIIIYDNTNNNQDFKKKNIIEGVLRLTSGVITRTNESNLTEYNFKLDFALPVDDKDLRLELEQKLEDFRKNIDNKIFNEKYKITTSIEVAVGNEFSYKDNNGRFRDFVNYYIIGSILDFGLFVGMENTQISLNDISVVGIIGASISLMNSLVENPIVLTKEIEYKLNNTKRAFSFAYQQNTSDFAKFISSILNNNDKKYDQLYNFKYVNKDSGIAIENIKVKITDITVNEQFGLISSVSVKVVESI